MLVLTQSLHIGLKFNILIAVFLMWDIVYFGWWIGFSLGIRGQ